MTYRRRDSYYKRAELDDRFGLLSRGDAVVDLGAWPGGWLQVVGERIGPTGRAVGVDVVPLTPLSFPNVSLVVGDVRDPATIEQVLRQLGRPADVVVSDLSPKLTGVGVTDETRRAELVAATVDAMRALLRPGGRLLTKVFMDPGYEAAIERLRAAFRNVRTTRPEATRRGSAELYVIATDHVKP